MTIWDVFTLMWRFRLLAVVMIGLTVGALVVASTPQVAAVGRVRVVFLAPETDEGNALAGTTASLVGMAGVVSRRVNEFSAIEMSVDGDVSLPAQGVRDGYSVRQPSEGGQWDTRYEEPVLDIQSTGADVDEARAVMDEAITEVLGTLEDLQDRESVPDELRIRTRLSPPEPVLTEQTGSRVRAMTVTGALGMLLTMGAVLLADSVSGARRRRKDAAPAPSASAGPDTAHPQHKVEEGPVRVSSGAGR